MICKGFRLFSSRLSPSFPHFIHNLWKTPGRKKTPEALFFRGFRQSRSGGIRTRGLLVPNRSTLRKRKYNGVGVFFYVFKCSNVRFCGFSSNICHTAHLKDIFCSKVFKNSIKCAESSGPLKNSYSPRCQGRKLSRCAFPYCLGTYRGGIGSKRAIAPKAGGCYNISSG